MNDFLSPQRDRVVLSSRRTALQAGSALLAAGALARAGSALAQSTPAAEGAGGGLLLVQGFGHGSLFPTQGDVGAVPYTVILWEAADRGFVYVARQAGVAGFASTNALIAAIEAGERPLAAVVVPAAADGSRPEQAWALRLEVGGLGSDPDAVTYQGVPVDEQEAGAWLGVAPETLPEGPQSLAAGYLIVAGLPGIDLPDDDRVRLALG